MNEWVIKMQNAADSKERKAIIEEYARITGRSISFCYKELKKSGYDSGRTARKDRGKSNINADMIKTVASLVKAGIRENGKKTMPVNVALDILKRNGLDVGVGESRLRELLREYKVDGENLKKETHHGRMRSEYPNQVHEVDPSVALIYFAPDSAKSKIIEDSEYYKNKDFFHDGKDKKGRQIKRKKCLRYVLTDHYSGSICVRYYSAYGETAEYLYDFLLYAWGRKEREDYAFHGVPETLLWDKGSANISKSVSNALKSLGVRSITHSAGNPRAKGQVENANNLIETHLECLFRIEGVSGIEEMNEAAERFCIEYNTKQKIKRMGMTISSRHSLWQKIPIEKLRELPDLELCRQIFSAGVLERKVRADLTVSLYHNKAKRTLFYSLINLPVEKGDRVNCQPLLFGDEYKAIIWFEGRDEYNKKIELSYEVKPIEVDEAGFDINAAVIGKEYKRTELTEGERETKAIEETAKEIRQRADANKNIPNLKTHSLIQPENKFIYQKEGEKITIGEKEKKEILLSYVETIERVKTVLGYVPDDLANQLKRDYPNGVSYSYADELIEFYRKLENEASDENII